jgi:HSP20 family protein
MSSLMRWQPISELVSLRDATDRLFEDSYIGPRSGWSAPGSAANLAINVYETKNEVVVKSALPGVKPEEVEVTITGNMLTISGESKEENEVKDKDYLRKERHFSSFTRSVTLPGGLKADQADASFENGVLTLKVPKSEVAKPKTTKVKAK